jgi:hypothetical protein
MLGFGERRFIPKHTNAPPFWMFPGRKDDDGSSKVGKDLWELGKSI